MIGEQFCEQFGTAGCFFFQPERELGVLLRAADTWDIVVDHVPDQHMLEAEHTVVLNRRAYLFLSFSFSNKFTLDQYIQRLEKGIDIKPSDEFDKTSQPESTSNHSGTLEYLLLNLAQQVDTRCKHALYGVGQRKREHIMLVNQRIFWRQRRAGQFT